MRNLGGTRGRGPEGPARPDLARRPIQKRKGVRAARVVRGTRSATRRNPTVVVHRRDARSSRHHPTRSPTGASSEVQGGEGPGAPRTPTSPVDRSKKGKAFGPHARSRGPVLAVRQGIKQRALAGCPCHLVLPTSKSPPPAASNWLPSTDHPFGAKSQCRPTVTSIHHPELYEGCPATIEPLSVPLQHAAVPVPRAHAQHGQAAIVSPWLLAQCYGHAVDAVCRRHDELRRAVADDPHEQGREHLHQLPVQSRSPQQ